MAQPRSGRRKRNRDDRSAAGTSRSKVQPRRENIDIAKDPRHYMAGAEGTQDVRVPPEDAKTARSRSASHPNRSAIPKPPEPEPKPEPPPPIPVSEPSPEPPPTNPIPPPPPGVDVRHRRRR